MLTLLMIAGLSGCKNTDGPTAWALNYATVTPNIQGGMEGVHVWEFFAEGWEKKREEEYYQCAVVQTLGGEPGVVPQGCTGCQFYYSIDLAPQDADCDVGLTNDPAISGVRGVGIGTVPADFKEDDPYPGQSMGWYISFDDNTALFHGYVYAEGLERGEPSDAGWVNGQSYTFWPAYAWSL